MELGNGTLDWNGNVNWTSGGFVVGWRGKRVGVPIMSLNSTTWCILLNGVLSCDSHMIESIKHVSVT